MNLVLTAAVLLQPAPDPAMEHYRTGSKAFVERRFDAAVDALTKSLALNPKQLRAVRLLGLSHQLAGHLDKAEAAFQHAIRLDPDDGESWFYLGRVHYLQNFFDKALPALQKSARQLPKDARVRECLALTLEAAGQPEAAEREYEQALRSAPPPTVHLNYGALLLKLNRVDESEKLLVKAAGLLPAFWQARFELGKLYYQTGRFELALTELKAALESASGAGESSRTHGLMALVYSRLGREEDARRSAEAAAK